MKFDDFSFVDPNAAERSRTVMRDRYLLENKLEKHLKIGKAARPFWTAAAGIIPFGLGGLVTGGSDALTDANIAKQNDKLNAYSAALGDPQTYNYTRLPSLDLTAVGQGIGGAVGVPQSFGDMKGSQKGTNVSASQVATNGNADMPVFGATDTGNWQGIWSGSAGGGITGLNSYETPPSTMEKGGTIKGASHDNGGVPIVMDGAITTVTAEGGEKIVNKQDWMSILNLLGKGKSKQAKALMQDIASRKPEQQELKNSGTVPDYITEAVSGVTGDGSRKNLTKDEFFKVLDKVKLEANGTPRLTSDIYNYLSSAGYTWPDSDKIRSTEPFIMETATVDSLPVTLDNTMTKVPEISVAEFKAQNPAPTSQKAPFDWQNALGYGFDAAKLGIGMAGASQALPEYTLPPEWNDYVDQSQQYSKQGLTPQQRAILNAQNASQYAAVSRDIVNASGGNAGVVLGNLNRANADLYNSNANIALQDKLLQRENFNQYGNVLAKDVAMNKDIFDMEYNYALANKEAGAQLANDALYNIESRADFSKMYGEGSAYDTYQKQLTAQGLSNEEIGRRMAAFAADPANWSAYNTYMTGSTAQPATATTEVGNLNLPSYLYKTPIR